MTRIATVPGTGGRNVNAFLDMLAWSEIGPALLKVSDDGYNVLVGSTPRKPILFADYAAHPHILNRALNSTAAGRYQFIFATWTRAAKACGLSSFGPSAQDLACIWLLKQCGSHSALVSGDFYNALFRAASQWASLPASTAGQPTHTPGELLGIYMQAGGQVRT